MKTACRSSEPVDRKSGLPQHRPTERDQREPHPSMPGDNQLVEQRSFSSGSARVAKPGLIFD